MLNPVWLQTLIAVATQRSFTRAAEALNLTQAAVSQHIQRLEAEYGPLLLRRSRQLELTPKGELLLEFAREQQLAGERLKNLMTSDSTDRGVIRLCTPGSIGLYLYPLLLNWQQQHPGLSIEHRFAPTDDILTAVLENRAEAGLVIHPPEDLRLTVRPFTEESLCLILPKDYPLQPGQPPSWTELGQLGFIDHPDGQDMARRFFGRQYPGQSIQTLPRSGFTNQIGLILEPVARGLGFSILPHYAVDSFVRKDALQIFKSQPGVNDTLWLIHRAEWPLSQRMQSALAYLAEHLAPAPH